MITKEQDNLKKKCDTGYNKKAHKEKDGKQKDDKKKVAEEKKGANKSKQYSKLLFIALKECIG